MIKPLAPAAADVIVLAGDIHAGLTTVEVVRTVTQGHPNAQVLFVPGNHYHNEADIGAPPDSFRVALRGIGNAHYLNRKALRLL